MDFRRYNNDYSDYCFVHHDPGQHCEDRPQTGLECDKVFVRAGNVLVLPSVVCDRCTPWRIPQFVAADRDRRVAAWRRVPESMTLRGLE